MPRVVQTEYMTKGPSTMNQKNGPGGRNNSYTPIVNRNVLQEKPKIQYDPNMVMRK